MDVGVDQLQWRSANGKPQTILEDPGRQYQWIDSRRSLVLTMFDRMLEPRQQLGRASGCNDLAVLEGGGAGDVIEVPMAERRW